MANQIIQEFKISSNYSKVKKINRNGNFNFPIVGDLQVKFPDGYLVIEGFNSYQEWFDIKITAEEPKETRDPYNYYYYYSRSANNKIECKKNLSLIMDGEEVTEDDFDISTFEKWKIVISLLIILELISYTDPPQLQEYR